MFVGIAVFANILNPEQLGMFFLFRSLVNVFSFVGDLGVGGALEKRMSEGEHKSKKFTTAIILVIPPVLILLGSILFFESIISSYLGKDITQLLILGSIAEIFNNIVSNTLRGELKVTEVGLLDLFQRLIWFFGGVLIILCGVQSNPLIYMYITGAGVSGIAGMYIQDTSVSIPSVKTARSLFQYAKYDIVTGAGSKLYNWFDILVIGAFLSPVAVAAYETAWALSSASIVLGKAIQTSVFPQFSAWAAENKNEKIKETLDQMVIGALFLVVPSLFGVVAISEELLMYIYGQEYRIAANALIVLMAVRLIQAFGQTIGRTLQAIDRPDQAAYSVTIGGILNISLNIVMVWRFELLGAAVATLISYIVVEWMRFYYLRKNMFVSIPSRKIVWCVFSSGIMLTGLSIIKRFYTISGIVPLILIVLIGVVFYVGMIYIHPYFREVIQSIVSSIMNFTNDK